MPPKRSGARYGSRKRKVRFAGYGRTGVYKRLGKRRGVFRGRKRRTGYRKRPLRKRSNRAKIYKRRKAKSFRTALTKATGIVHNIHRNVISQWVVPLTVQRNVGFTTVFAEPMAQYLYPKLTGNEEQFMYGPMCLADWKEIGNKVGLLDMFSTQTTNIYKMHWLVSYKARYQVLNNNNIPVTYAAIIFKCKKNVPYTSPVDIDFSNSYTNPLNVAGAYLARSGDVATADLEDARNIALHTERVNMEKLPPIYEYWKVIKKQYFTLSPGRMKTHVIKGKQRKYRLIEQYPGPTVQPSPDIAQPRICWWKGTTYILYKAIAAPADFKEAVEPPNRVDKLSTYTTPASIISYQVNYNVIVPDTANDQLRNKTHFLGGSGFGAPASAAEVELMADVDIKKEVIISS